MPECGQPLAHGPTQAAAAAGYEDDFWAADHSVGLESGKVPRWKVAADRASHFPPFHFRTLAPWPKRVGQATRIAPLQPFTLAAFRPWGIQRELDVRDLPRVKCSVRVVLTIGGYAFNVRGSRFRHAAEPLTPNCVTSSYSARSPTLLCTAPSPGCG